MIEGRITKIISNLYTVTINTKQIDCQARGKFRKEKMTPLVGDYCKIDEKQKWIVEILPRKNSLERPSIANVDSALIVTAVKNPDFSSLLLDKLLVLTTLHHIHPIICFTKVDLLTKTESETYHKWKETYQRVGYDVVENTEISRINQLLSRQVIVITGQTGAGKSTLINELCPSLKLKTSPISKSLNRGVHTTRHTELFPINDYYIADTPGFSSLELKGYSPEEIKSAFPEFAKYSCRYKDCNHDKETDCKVKKAVEEGEISLSRYESYQRIKKEV